MRHAAAAFLILTVAACSDPAPASPADGLSGPYTHGNLSVYLVHSAGAPQNDFDGLTLEEALKSGAIRITEKAEGAEVNELQVENVGERPVYLQAGDTVKGGQQDRTIAVDAVLPPKSGKRGIDAFCVEPGRWHARDDKSAVVFAAAKAPVATNEQKLAIRLEKNQGKVWAAGEKVNRDLAKAEPVSPARGGGAPQTGATFSLDEPKNSYVEAIEDPNVQKKLDERIAALEKAPAGRKNVVGAVFCMNGKVQSAEIYSGSGLFRKLWPKLLRSASVEAISQQKDGPAPPAPAESDVRALLSGLEDGAARTEQRPGGQTVRVVEKERAVRFDTESEGKLLHRQVITK